MVRPSLDFFSLIFAPFKAGSVPVLIDPGIGLSNLGRAAMRRPRRSLSAYLKRYWRVGYLVGDAEPCAI